MALLGSLIFNTVFYLSLIPISISIIILYFFLSTKKLFTIIDGMPMRRNEIRNK